MSWPLSIKIISLLVIFTKSIDKIFLRSIDYDKSKKFEVWFVIGGQHLYSDAALAGQDLEATPRGNLQRMAMGNDEVEELVEYLPPAGDKRLYWL